MLIWYAEQMLAMNVFGLIFRQLYVDDGFAWDEDEEHLAVVVGSVLPGLGVVSGGFDALLLVERGFGSG